VPEIVLCQKCGSKKASVHLTKISDGIKSEMYICENCASENGELDYTMEDKFPLYQFFSSMMGLGTPESDPVLAPVATREVQCPACGLTYSQFGQIGRFGCARCYVSFGKDILPLFRRLHGNQKHMGKIPARAGAQLKFKQKLEHLKLELQKKVVGEEFEEAAQLRDKIRELEKELAAGGETDVCA
jgi:protein arginine kinase activator